MKRTGRLHIQNEKLRILDKNWKIHLKKLQIDIRLRKIIIKIYDCMTKCACYKMKRMKQT